MRCQWVNSLLAVPALPRFHAGEAAALTLALQEGWWLLINESPRVSVEQFLEGHGPRVSAMLSKDPKRGLGAMWIGEMRSPWCLECAAESALASGAERFMALPAEVGVGGLPLDC